LFLRNLIVSLNYENNMPPKKNAPAKKEVEKPTSADPVAEPEKEVPQFGFGKFEYID